MMVGRVLLLTQPKNEISPTIPIDVTWVATATTETQCYDVVLHQPTTVASIHGLLELPMQDQEVFLTDTRGPRRISGQWEVRENCQVHIVAQRFAHVGAARIAELRSCLHRVIPTTIRGEPSRFIVWMWDGLIFCIQRVPPNAMLLAALAYASELQQMINVYREASLRLLGPDGWIPADLMSEPQVPPLHPVISICLNPIHTSVVADPQSVELWFKWPGVSKARVLRVQMHCDLRTACRAAHHQDQGDFDALEPWVNGHQIAWDTKVHQLTSLVVSLRMQGVCGGGKSKNLSTRCATILLQQGADARKQNSCP